MISEMISDQKFERGLDETKGRQRIPAGQRPEPALSFSLCTLQDAAKETTIRSFRPEIERNGSAVGVDFRR